MFKVVFQRISKYVIWAYKKLYQMIAALLVFVLIGADGLMHAFGIPHVEGWWITLAGGLIAASGIGVWLKKQKKFHKKIN